MVAGQVQSLALAQEPGMGEHQLRRQDAVADQFARTVDVLEHQVEQLGTLDQPRLDAPPLLALQ